MAYSSSNDLPTLYSIFLCEVGRLEAYGIFVKIPGFKKNGLVHKTQMSNTRIEDPEDMAAVGDRVYCKVISVDDEGKIGMSMKVVNQTTGNDQDPSHVQASLDEQRRKTGHIRGTKMINLGAVLNTTCSKCGGKGHFAQDCFHVPGATAYELLPDVGFMMQQQAEEESKGMGRDHKHHKKKKKERKEERKGSKKHKKRKRHSDSDDSEVKSKAKKSRKDRSEKSKLRDDSRESAAHDSSLEKRLRLLSGDPGKHTETDKQIDREKQYSKETDKHIDKEGRYSKETVKHIDKEGRYSKETDKHIDKDGRHSKRVKHGHHGNSKKHHDRGRTAEH